MNKRVIAIVGAVMVSGILASACSAKAVEIDSKNINVDKEVEANLVTEESTVEKNVQDEVSAFDVKQVALEALQSYFQEVVANDLDIQEVDFSDDIKIVNFIKKNEDMTQYSVKVSLVNKNAFMIQNLTGEDKLMALAKEATGLEKFSTKELYDFKYSLEPMTEEEALEMANGFLNDSPLANETYELKDTKFEYRFDTKDKEFFDFEYEVTNEKKDTISVFIKIDNYLQTVTEISGL